LIRLKKQGEKEKGEEKEEWRKEQGEKPEQQHQHHVAEEVPSASQASPLKPQSG
jgi:hypothetical protein